MTTERKATTEEIMVRGFKAVIDELQRIGKTVGKIEQHAFTASSTLIAIQADLKVLRNASQITDVAVLEMKRMLAEGQHDKSD